MRVTSKNHDGIIVVDVLPEENEKNACLWIRVYLDPEHGQMLSDSDIGAYSHRWPETGKDFLKLMSSVDKGYLLNKCCHSQKDYDTDAIIESIHEYFRDYCTDGNSKDRAFEQFLDDLDGCSNVFEIYRVFDETVFSYGDAWECITKTYMPWHKEWAGYFCKYVRPEAKKWAEQWDS